MCLIVKLDMLHLHHSASRNVSVHQAFGSQVAYQVGPQVQHYSLLGKI